MRAVCGGHSSGSLKAPRRYHRREKPSGIGNVWEALYPSRPGRLLAMSYETLESGQYLETLDITRNQILLGLFRYARKYLPNPTSPFVRR